MLRRTKLGGLGAKVAGALGAAALASGLTGAVVASPAEAATFKLVTCTAGQPNNLQETIDSAPAGSTVAVRGVCTGNFTIPRNLTLVGPATLDGRTGLQFPIVLTVNSGVRAVVDLLTIQHGTRGVSNTGTLTLDASRVSNNAVSNPAQFPGDAAGIFNGGTMTVNASQVSDNTAGGNGGGIVNFGNLVINASRVSANTASTGEGGGIYNVSATTTLRASSVVNNTATADDGGGILNAGGGTINLVASSVSNNTAVDGGGIFNTVTSRVHLLASLVLDNRPDNCAPPNSVPGCRD